MLHAGLWVESLHVLIQQCSQAGSCLSNDHKCTCPPTLAACDAIYFEDRFCGSWNGRIRDVGWIRHGVLCTWRLSWLAVEKLG